MPLQAQYPNLQATFGQDSLFNTLYGMDQYNQAKTNEQQNLSQAIQTQKNEAEMQPINVRRGNANVAHTQALTGYQNALTPGAQASSNMKTREDMADSQLPMEMRVKAATTHLAATMSSDDLLQMENHVKVGLTDPDPQKRAAAAQMYPMLSSIKAEQMKIQQQGDQQVRVANAEGASRLAVENAGIKAGKYNKNSLDYLAAKAATGNFQAQSGYWTQKALQAQAAAQQSTGEEQQFYIAQSRKAAQLADAARNADRDSKSAAAYQALAKSPDLAPLGITPLVPSTAIGPTAPSTDDIINGKGKPPPSGDTVTVTKDGKKATIPKDKLDAAKAAGWNPQ